MKSIKDSIKVYLEWRCWHQLRPVDLSKSIMIECGEISVNSQREKSYTVIQVKN